MYVSNLCKKVFSGALVKFVFLYGSNNSDSFVFRNVGFGEIKDHSLRTTLFQKKKNCYGSFVYVSTLRKKVFLGAPVKCVFLYGSKNSDSVVFKNVGFAEIKDHSLRRTPSQKTVCNRGFMYMPTLREKVFSGALVNCFFLYGSNNSDSVIFRNAGFGEMKDHTFSTIDFCKSF